MQDRQEKSIKFHVTRPQNIDTVKDVVDLKGDLSWSCSGKNCPKDEKIVEHFNLNVNFANGEIKNNFMQHRLLII